MFIFICLYNTSISGSAVMAYNSDGSDSDYDYLSDNEDEESNIDHRKNMIDKKLARLYEEYNPEIEYEKDTMAAAKARYSAENAPSKYRLVNESTKLCASNTYKSAAENQTYTYNRMCVEMKHELDELNAYYTFYVIRDYKIACEYKQLYMYILDSIKSKFRP
jgi:hypothetical protein